MANISNLKDSMDLSSIDINKLGQVLADHQNKVAHFLVIALAVIILAVIFHDDQKKEQALQAQLSFLNNKAAILAQRDQGIKSLAQFKDSLPKGLKNNEIIPTITKYATAHGVFILSLSPSQRQDMGLYNISLFHVTASAQSYKDIVLFLKDLETSPYAFRIETWSGSETDQSHGISCNIDISVLDINI